MALVKLILPPDQASYSVADGRETAATQLEGGASRYRRDILGATSRVTAQWTCTPEKYKYLRSFYRGTTESGSLPFEIDLLLDEPTLTAHKAYFVPGSMALRQQQGLTYVVAAELEVYPAEVSEYASDFVTMYNNFGEAILAYENKLDIIVNIDLPGAL